MIRPATPADRAAIEAIVREAYTPWIEVIGARPMPMMADYAALIDAGQVHVLEPDDAPGPEDAPGSGDAPKPDDVLAPDDASGSVAALIVLVAEPEAGTLVVDNLAVRPSAQHRGHGRRLMAFAEDRARAVGLPAIRIYTNAKMTSNIALYRSLGYQETARDTITGRDVVHLRKELSPPAAG